MTLPRGGSTKIRRPGKGSNYSEKQHEAKNNSEGAGEKSAAQMKEPVHGKTVTCTTPQSWAVLRHEKHFWTEPREIVLGDSANMWKNVLRSAESKI